MYIHPTNPAKGDIFVEKKPVRITRKLYIQIYLVKPGFDSAQPPVLWGADRNQSSPERSRRERLFTALKKPCFEPLSQRFPFVVLTIFLLQIFS